MLPGLDGTGKLFANVLEELAGSIETQVIRYPTEEPLGYAELESRVRGELPRGRPFVILGESFSGPIAIRIAAYPPPGLTGLILCATFARNPYPWLRWARHLTFLVPLKSLPRWVRALIMWGRDSSGRIPAQSDRAIADVAARVVHRRIAEILRVDASEALRRVRLPSLILYATRDRVIPAAATRWLRAQLPAAAQAPIDGPHLLLQARPRECAAAIEQFLRSLAPDSR
jgi:pimeloyl-ACP methyl ester carboxylesterase